MILSIDNIGKSNITAYYPEEMACIIIMVALGRPLYYSVYEV